MIIAVRCTILYFPFFPLFTVLSLIFIYTLQILQVYTAEVTNQIMEGLFHATEFL